MIPRQVPLILITLAALSAPPSLDAGVLRVPKHYGTIQSALDAATSGDIVEVAGGVYVEHLVISHKATVTLRARDGAKVFVDAGGSGVPLQIVQAANIRIERIRLRNSSDSAGVVITDSAKRVTVVKCRVSGTQRGIEISDHANGNTIEKCIVQGVADSAIDLQETSEANLVVDNELGDFGIGIRARGVLHTIEENRLFGPGITGIALTGCERSCVIGNVIEGIASYGIVADITTDCIVTGNVVTGGGSGIRVYSGSVGMLIQENKVVGAVYGIITFADGLRLMGNTAKKCVEAGYSLSGERLLVHRNVAVKSKAHGFDVMTSDSSYLGNVAKLSGAAGLYISASAHDQNVFVDNSFGSIIVP